MALRLIPLGLLKDEDSILSFVNKSIHKSRSDWISQSIIEDGLLNPLVCKQKKEKFVVIDGKKRLAAMRRINKAKLLPKSIAKVPCIIHHDETFKSLEPSRPLLLTEQELVHRIITAKQSSMPLIDIALKFECDLSIVEQAISLSRVHPEIIRHFNNKIISLKQTAAFSNLEDMEVQLDILNQVGPFVSETNIIKAIRSSARQRTATYDNVVIFPPQKPDNKDGITIHDFDKIRRQRASAASLKPLSQLRPALDNKEDNQDEANKLNAQRMYQNHIQTIGIQQTQLETETSQRRISFTL